MTKKAIQIDLGTSGMFCELNHLIAACYWADEHDLVPWPRWVGGLYSKPGEDAWPIYFHRPPRDEVEIVDQCRVRDPRFQDYRIASPRGPKLPEEAQQKYGCPDYLMPPTDRKKAENIILQFMVPRTVLLHPLHSNSHAVGLHLRGPGRLHGGAGYLADKLGRGRPPYAAYYDAVDRQLASGASHVLLCTDAGCVVDRVRNRYGSRVIVSSTITPDTGEPHVSKAADPETLGWEALKDVCGLCRCRWLVHGNSNMSNFVLCVAPNLGHQDIYAEVYP